MFECLDNKGNKWVMKWYDECSYSEKVLIHFVLEGEKVLKEFDLK